MLSFPAHPGNDFAPKAGQTGYRAGAIRVRQVNRQISQSLA